MKQRQLIYCFFFDKNSAIEKIQKITTEVINQAFDLNVTLNESRKSAELIMKIVKNV